jgi:hypothetical protein
METTIKNHIEELQLSAERMLLLNSDNKVLISYFKDLKEKLLYLKELSMIETKFNWNEVENIMDLLKNQDEQLSHINLEFQIREKQQKHYAFLKIKR